MRPTPSRIINAKGNRSFGGSQMWFENKVMLNSGCGIVAGCDAVMRLLDEDEFSKDDYMARLNEATTFIRLIMLPFKMKPLIIAGQEFLGSFGVSPARFKRDAYPFTISIIPDVAGILWECKLFVLLAG